MQAQKLEVAIDSIRVRFGSQALTRAAELPPPQPWLSGTAVDHLTGIGGLPRGRLAQRHARKNPEGLRFFRRRDDVLVPSPDDHRDPVQVRSPRKLEVCGQTTADAHDSNSPAWIGFSVTSCG